jgi:hypothetical protein
VNILFGLADVAAVVRGPELATEIRILLRRYQDDAQYALSIVEKIRICIIAAASHPDLISWRDFVGDWLTEMAFNDLADDDGELFHSHLKCLCHTVPELWISCGKADAALLALNQSRSSG